MNIKLPYGQAIGALLYLMVSTRPDIIYAVGVASKSLENSSPEEVCVKTIFWYLKATEDFGITYHAGKETILEW